MNQSMATSSSGSNAAEFCGGTAASCAALWCCGPCSLLKLLVLAVYEAPRGAIRRLRRKKVVSVTPMPATEEKLVTIESTLEHNLELKRKNDEEEEEDEAVIALENEMWNRFNNGGFLRRSISVQETASSSRIRN